MSSRKYVILRTPLDTSRGWGGELFSKTAAGDGPARTAADLTVDVETLNEREVAGLRAPS